MSDVSKLTGNVDKIKYVLQHYMAVPKNISDTFNEQEISFRYTDANIGHNKSMIGDAVRGDLYNVLRRLFPSATAIDITVNTNDIDDVRYNLVIDIILLIDGKSYSISSNYQLDNEGNLVYNFTGD